MTLTYDTDWQIHESGRHLAYVPVILQARRCQDIYLSWSDVKMTEPAKAFLAFLKARLAETAEP